MAEKFTNYKCIACGGPMAFDANTGKLKCEYCDSLYTVEEVKARYEKENKEIIEDAADVKDEYFNVADGMKAYQCKSCGAEMVTDPTTAATSCPYCGNTAIIPQQMDKMMKPRYVIPFKIDKEGAKGKLKEYCKGKKLLPGTFTNSSHIDEIKGVYVPFWLYSGIVEAECQYDAEISEEKRTQTEKITTTKHYDVKRKGTVTFNYIPTDASESMPDDLMDSIEPYDYKDLTRFEMEYLLGFIADQYDVDAEESKKRARKRAEASAVEEAEKTVKNYSSVDEKEQLRKIVYKSEKEEYAMLPVWLLSTKWNNQNFLFAVNGQTGEMTGNLPVDRTKQIIRDLLWFIPIALIISILSHFSTTGIIAGVVIGLIVALIANSIMVGSMKPVRKKEYARSYVKEMAGGVRINLSVKEDTYINTTVKKEPINNGSNTASTANNAKK